MKPLNIVLALLFLGGPAALFSEFALNLSKEPLLTCGVSIASLVALVLCVFGKSKGLYLMIAAAIVVGYFYGMVLYWES